MSLQINSTFPREIQIYGFFFIKKKIVSVLLRTEIIGSIYTDMPETFTDFVPDQKPVLKRYLFQTLKRPWKSQIFSQ